MSIFKNKKIIAIFAAAAMMISLLIANLAGTFAQANDYTKQLEDPYPSYTMEIEVNKTENTPSNIRAFAWSNADSTILQMTAKIKDKFAEVKGLKPGVSMVSAGLNSGQIFSLRYKVVDSTNITSYTIAGGLETAIAKKGGKMNIPVFTTPDAAASKIVWTSLNSEVATVSGRTITAEAATGSVIILGKFTDKWGIEQTIPYLVVVGAGTGSGSTNNIRNDLMDLILEGLGKLGENPNPYTKDSLDNLRDAVNDGIKVAGDKNASDNDINKAIKDLQDALSNLKTKPTLPEGIIIGDDGNFYKPVGNPPNVFEVVDENGNSQQPPKYVYNPTGKPGNSSDRPAHPNGNGGFKVEDPKGSNIWKDVDNNGNLKDSPATWGGPDRKPGTNDDKTAVLGGDGNYYVEDPNGSNIWKQIDKGGNLVNNPAIWGGPDRKPGTGDDKTAVLGDDGKYYVEDPNGSNIWKQIDKDGNLINNPAIWGGPDGKPGTGDDKEAKEFDGKYWIDMGQNVWKQVDKLDLGPLTGGGPDKNPATEGVTPIYDNTNKDGKYYVGPLGPDSDGNEYFYGDKATGGDGLLNSTADSLKGDDEKYYKDANNGNMTTTKPVKPSAPSEYPNVVEGRILSAKDAGDASDWVEIAQYSDKNGDFSLIMRTNYISYNGNALFNTNNSTGYNDPRWNYTPFGAKNSYDNSNVRKIINDWFNGIGKNENLPMNARLREYTMQHNAMYALGTTCNLEKSLHDGISYPTKYQVGEGNDIAFAPSYSEAANYVSKSYFMRGVTATPESSLFAKKNYEKLSIPVSTNSLYFAWLRTPGERADSAGSLESTQNAGAIGRVFQMSLSNVSPRDDRGLVYPAVWVKSSIFSTQAN